MSVTGEKIPQQILIVGLGHFGMTRAGALSTKGADRKALKRTTENILERGEINRQALREADTRAKQLGYAGAWGVVFMADGRQTGF